MVKISTLEIKNIEIETKEKQRAMIKKIKLALRADRSWPVHKLDFREQFYLGHIGFEVLIEHEGTVFITERVLEALKILNLRLGTIGLLDKKLMLTIWNKEAPLS